jgi:hypothetical protein
MPSSVVANAATWWPYTGVVLPVRLHTLGIDERLPYLPGGQRRVLVTDVLFDRIRVAHVGKDDPRHGKLR